MEESKYPLVILFNQSSNYTHFVNSLLRINGAGGEEEEAEEEEESPGRVPPITCQYLSLPLLFYHYRAVMPLPSPISFFLFPLPLCPSVFPFLFLTLFSFSSLSGVAAHPPLHIQA
ncbi:hypothetical protein E2C01_086047 [Portunus trituberculatus]|uniref:Uncharacterized protein n=1 Tax=Portunus trituberculatus TaxID=210409 RepID=A0A5B7JCE1_PORTR|nr:hypothetical protein [Portunus trituberculatus]